MIAEQTITVTVDDFDKSSPAERQTYYFQGATYEVDLSDENRTALKDALSNFDAAVDRMTEFVNVSRPVVDELDQAVSDAMDTEPEPEPKPKRKRRTRKAADSPRATDTEVRQWARGKGIEVNVTGRVAKTVRAAYEVEHQK